MSLCIKYERNSEQRTEEAAVPRVSTAQNVRVNSLASPQNREAGKQNGRFKSKHVLGFFCAVQTLFLNRV